VLVLVLVNLGRGQLRLDVFLDSGKRLFYHFYVPGRIFEHEDEHDCPERPFSKTANSGNCANAGA
jgi:hypothetical protein